MANVTLTVEGMMCQNCKAKVEKALNSLGGVSFCTVDLDAGKASVSYDGDVVAPDAMKAAVEEKGFTVTAVA